MSLDTESMFERIGDLELPFRESSVGQSGLAALDPSRDLLLALFASAINSELGEAYARARQAVTLSDTLGLLPVSDTFPDEPNEQNLRQRKAVWPLLALHRSGVADYESFTLEITRLVQPWKLHYILGPLDVIDSRQLKDIGVAVTKIVAMVIRKRGHKSFQNGALQFFGAGSPNNPSPISWLKLDGYEGGQAAFGVSEGSTLYWAIEMHLKTWEMSSYVDDPAAVGDDLDAADITAAVGGEDVVPDLVVVATDADPNAT